MKPFLLQPHPNYIKVIHTYIWLVYFILVLISYGLLDSTLYIIASIVLLLVVPAYLMKRFWNVFIRTIYNIEINDNLVVTFSSFLLENAYGIGTIHTSENSFKGVHINDFRRLQVYLENKSKA